MLATETEYGGLGIGEAFVQWGCDLADKDDLPVYIDASEKGAPFYQKRFGALPRSVIPIPEKPETFGKVSVVDRSSRSNTDSMVVHVSDACAAEEVRQGGSSKWFCKVIVGRARGEALV